MLKFLLYALLATLIYAAAATSSDVIADIAPQDGRIVGGREVNVMQHPHQCSLRHRSLSSLQFSHSCGGSLYNSTTLITAAHCVNGRTAKNFMVVCGTNNRRGSDGAISPVKAIVMHPEYFILAKYDYDVAIVFLTVEMPINNITIAPIKLAAKHPESGVKAIITGWGGLTEGGSSPELLQEVEVPIVSNDFCGKQYAVIDGVVTDRMLCAGIPAGGKDACQGDSGGPLVVDSQLAGIVSWGEGCARGAFPGVYSSVPSMKDWIEAIIFGTDIPTIPPIDELHVDFL